MLRWTEKILYSCRRPGIAVRLTLSFILFGIIIGYVSYMYFIMESTHSFISATNSIVADKYFSLTKDKPGDYLISPSASSDSEFQYGLRLIRDLTYVPGMQIHFDINFFDNNTLQWNTIIITDNGVSSVAKTDPAMVADLTRSVKHRFRSSSKVYFGRSDSINMFINISRPQDRNNYIITLSANRQGITNILSRNVYQTWLYAALLLILSTALGRFFGRRLARPIEMITAEAEEMAAGDFNRSFSVKRKDEIGRLGESLSTMALEIKNRIAEIQRRMNAMETMNRIDKAVLSSISRFDLLDSVVDIVSKLFEDSFAAMVLRNEDRSGYEVLSVSGNAQHGIITGKPFIHKDAVHPFIVENATQVFQCRKNSGGTELDAYRYFLTLTDDQPGIIANIPVFIADKYQGSLFITRTSTTAFTDDEIATLKMIADQVGVALHSVKSFEEKENLLVGIMIALTKSIDAKSKWTAGHSERVAHYSELIAQKMGLTSSEMRSLSFSAILHDIGKIAVPEKILDKPDKLTNDEYAVIKTHPESGAHIIRDISLYTDIMPGILYHHEHWDGSGYPRALSGAMIPLAGRIIAVADVYDAITAERPYRKGMSRETADEFMKNNAGVLFDPEIVDIFMEILREE